MLDDFSAKPTDGQALTRYLVAGVCAGVVLVGLGVAALLLPSEEEAEVEEGLVQVEFQDLLEEEEEEPPPEPEPEPPPPEPEPEPPPRPRIQQPPPPPEEVAPLVRRGTTGEIDQVEEIPEEQASESDAELEAQTEQASVGDPEGSDDPRASARGSTRGRIGGRGRAPAPPPPPSAPPPPPRRNRGPVRNLPSGATQANCANNSPPQTTAALRSAGVPSIRVIVRLTIATDGRVTNAQVLRGHELMPDSNVLSAVRSWRCEPARLANGEAIAVIKTQPIRINVQL